MKQIKRLDLYTSYAAAADDLHAWAKRVKDLGMTPRYGVRIGKKVFVRNRWRYPIYLCDEQPDEMPRLIKRSA